MVNAKPDKEAAVQAVVAEFKAMLPSLDAQAEEKIKLRQGSQRTFLRRS